MAAQSLGFSIWARDTAAATFTKLAQSVDRLQDRLQRLDRTSANPEVTVETAKAQRDLDQFVATMRTKLAAAARALPEIKLTADSSDLDRELAGIRAKIVALRTNIELDADPAQALAEIQALSTRLRALGAQSADVEVRANVAGALRGLGAVEAEARRLDGRNVRVKADVDGVPGAVGKLAALKAASDNTGSSFFASANSFLHFSKTMSIVTAVVGLTGPALGALGTAVAALPAFLFSVGLPAAAVAAGLDGIKAAADGLMPAFGRMRTAVSQTFQQGLTPVLQSLLPLFPMVTSGLQSMAGGLTNVARQTVAMVTSAVGVAQIGAIFAGVRVLIDGMAPAMAIFTQNLLTMAAVGIGEFSRLGAVFTAAAVQFRSMLAGLIDSGAFQAAVRGFVDIMGGLLTVLNRVIGVAIQLGAQLATPITNALTAVGNAIVALAPIMGLFGGAFLGLITMFANAISQLAPVITPIISVILGLAMTILNTLLPPLVTFVQQILTAALPVLTQLAVTLGSVLSGAMVALAPLFPVLVSMVQQLLAAVAPLIPQIAMLATQLISGLAPILPQLVGLFMSLVMALIPVLPPIIQLATAYVPILVAVIQALMPVVTAVANAFLAVLGALMPLLPPIMQLVQALLPPMLAITQAVLPVVVALANAFTQVVLALMPLLPPIIQLAMVILPPLVGSFAWAAQVAGTVLTGAINILGGVLSWLIGILVSVVGGIINFVTTAIGWFQTFGQTFGGIWGAIMVAFQMAWQFIYNTAVTVWTAISTFFQAGWLMIQVAWNALWAAFSFLFRESWGFIQRTAMAVWNAMVAFWQPAFQAISALWTQVWNAISGFFAIIWGAIRGVAITVWNAIVAFFRPAFTFFQALWGGVWAAISGVFTTVWNWIRNTAVTIWNAISFYFNTALTIFTSFWSGIWNNIVAFFSRIWNTIWAYVQFYWAMIKFYWDVALNAFTSFWSGIWNNIVGFFSRIWNNIWAYVQFYWAMIKFYYNLALNQFKEFWGGIWNSIVERFDRIWSGISGIAQRVWDNVKGIFIGSINWVIDRINDFLGVINRIAGVLGFKIDLHINRLGDGGPVNRPGPTTSSSTAAGLATGGPVHRAGGGGVNAAAGGKLPATGKSYDSLPAVAGQQRYLLMGDEWVVRRTSSRAIGAAGMNAINNADRHPVDIIPRRDGGPVISEKTARRHAPFLNAVADGQAEAVGAANAMGGTGRMLAQLERGSQKARRTAGGAGATMPGYRSKTLDAIGRDLGGAIAFARAQSGKPYIWGGVGPAGYDCSGYQSAITNVLRNQGPHRRIGTTATFPWGGFRPGLFSRYAVGAFKGNPGHMAGTLDGVNVESGGSPSRTKYGAQAAGADHRQFNIKASLPEVGGQFAPGGGGGGLASAAAHLALDPVYNLLRGIRDNPGEDLGKRSGAGGGVKALDYVFQKAAAMDAMFGGGMDTSGISGPVVEQVRQVAARFGWDREPFWGALVRLIQKESSWNPGAANPRSTARGLFQKMTSLYGPIEATPAGQAAWGLDYIRGRYGDPVRALAFHDAHGSYDRGGWLEPGLNLAYNATGHREPVLPLAPGEWRDMVRGQSGGRVGGGDEYDKLARAIARELRDDRSLIGSLSIQAPQGASASEVVHELSRELRLARLGGVHG